MIWRRNGAAAGNNWVRARALPGRTLSVRFAKADVVTPEIEPSREVVSTCSDSGTPDGAARARLDDL